MVAGKNARDAVYYCVRLGRILRSVIDGAAVGHAVVDASGPARQLYIAICEIAGYILNFRGPIKGPV